MSPLPSNVEASNPVVGNQDPAVSCTHCGLPVPPGLIEFEADTVGETQFCCSGCRLAYRLIHSSGLDAYYGMADSGESASLKDREWNPSTHRFSEFDSDAFFDRYCQQIDESTTEVTLLLDGIHCAACIWLIEKLPQITPGVLDVKLNWAKQSARLRWNNDRVRLSRITRDLSQLGYTPHPISESEHDLRRQNENRRHLVRIGIAAAAAGNNMLIAASLYLGMFSYMSVGMSQMLRIASCVVGLVSLIWPGRVFLQGAASAIRTRTPHMDLPIALGLTIGSVAGLVNTIRGTGELYFDSLSVLIFLLLVGRWIQFRQQNRAADAVELLYRLTPRTTRKIVDGRPVETLVDLVAANDLLEIRPGDLFPVDGEIIDDGKTQVDEAILSGESALVTKRGGDPVLAGTRNCQSAVQIRALATGQETRLSRIVGLVEQATLDKPEVVQWANRVGGVFVVTVIVMAMVTLLTWIWIDPALAVDRAVALLIVACPCALALATPLAISVALGRSAKQKIMIKGGDVLQLLSRPGMLWLDKTGTLTDGRLEVVRWYGNTNWKMLIADIETKSSHPVGRAIVEFVRGKVKDGEEVRLPNCEVVEYEGRGLKATTKRSTLLIGNATLMNDYGVLIGPRHRKIADRILDRNQAPCWIAVNGNVNAILAIGDQIRPDTQSAVAKLKSSGWTVGVLSGDHQRIVDQVARRLEIEPTLARGGTSPEGKVKTVQDSLLEYPCVVMVGDGVNDSAALAAASVGIAVHNGAEASLAAAPVYLAEEGLNPILELLRISKSTRRTISWNFAASLSYNLIGASAAAVGLINPLVAAILMPISSLTVVGISLTAGRTHSKGDPA